MKITFTEHDRKLLMKRFRAAMKMDHPEEIITVLHVTEIYCEQQAK